MKRIVEYKPIRHEGYPALIKECSVLYDGSLNTPEMVSQFVRDNYCKNELEENVYVLATNIKNKPLGFFCVSHGTSSCSLISPREVFQRALLLGADNVILIHNHPSGDVTPSKEDINVTKMVKEAGNIVGVKLLDHIIVSDTDYCSFSQQKIL